MTVNRIRQAVGRYQVLLQSGSRLRLARRGPFHSTLLDAVKTNAPEPPRQRLPLSISEPMDADDRGAQPQLYAIASRKP